MLSDDSNEAAWTKIMSGSIMNEIAKMPGFSGELTDLVEVEAQKAMFDAITTSCRKLSALGGKAKNAGMVVMQQAFIALVLPAFEAEYLQTPKTMIGESQASIYEVLSSQLHGATFKVMVEHFYMIWQQLQPLVDRGCVLWESKKAPKIGEMFALENAVKAAQKNAILNPEDTASVKALFSSIRAFIGAHSEYTSQIVVICTKVCSWKKEYKELSEFVLSSAAELFTTVILFGLYY